MAKPFIAVFNVGPKTINKGEEVVFIWQVLNSTTRHLTDKGDILPFGSWTTEPTITKTYTLTAENPDGTSEKTQTVTVIQPPPPPPSDTHNWRFNTVPGFCLITIEGYDSGTSNSTGYFLFPDVPEGLYDWSVSKTGYITETGQVNLIRSKVSPVALEEEEEEPPPPEECPDFWVDPVGAVICWIIRSLEAALGLVSGGFISFLIFLQEWAAAFTLDFWQFLQDPVSKIQTWMSGIWVEIQNLGEEIATGISDWWTETVIDVGVMITDATTGFSSWIDESFTDINAWWENIKTVWGTFWTDKITEMQEWVADFTINVNNWYNSNLKPIIDAINSGLSDAGTWIAGFPTLIGEWWQDRVIEVGVWIVEATTNFNNFLGDFTGTIGDWWNDRVIEIGIWLAERDIEFNNWVKNILPGIVEKMFEWAKPIVQPIMDAVGFLGQIVGIVTGTAPESESVKSVKENYKEQTDRINEILGRP